MTTRTARQFTSALYILAAMLLAGLGLKSFLLPSHFIDGGVTGVSMLVSALSGVPLPALLLVVNAPFIAIAYRHVGRMFAVKSLIGIAGLAALLAFFPYPAATTDKLLAAVFGGFFVGAGIGLAIRGGSVLDGTEVLALILSKKTFATVGGVILALNVCIFTVAAFFLGIEPALYSMLTYFAASKTIDFLLHGIEQLNGVLIFSPQSAQVKDAILNEMGRGVTILKGLGGFTETEQDVLFCVITRLEITRIKTIVAEWDDAAFVVMLPVGETSGGVVKRRVFH